MLGETASRAILRPPDHIISNLLRKKIIIVSQASCDSPGQFESTTYEAHFRLYTTSLPDKRKLKKDRAMASLRSKRQDALISMNIGFLRLPPHLKSRCLRLTFKSDFLRVTYGTLGALRTENTMISKCYFKCFFITIFAENPITDITKLGN